ncbi:beta-glucosidase [Microcella alkaliphila]|uniref:Beta-glucosidase n=1 Tax=Microcella alkaliphila TaxID=279828 RepID=A0A4V6MD13_9MICO|nr:family 1 glycosylhydrolase [Microcella alkaliphila]RZT66469.1 beta-glucosidase [Microcella alkaliphila]
MTKHGDNDSHPFLWGVSTAAYQIEGAAAEDGRGPSIWDTFSHEPGRVLHGDTGDIATDHYHRLEEDLDLLNELGVDVYRFSFSWSRVLPTGRGKVNERGLEFYDRLIDGLLERGILPVPTLYHWDLPQVLQDEGGWAATATVDAFVEYAAVMAARYASRVRMWTTINEPWVATYLGNAIGVHAPGNRDHDIAARVHHHMLVAHAAAAARIRSAVEGASVGIALNMSHIYSAVDSPASDRAAALAFDQLVMSFLEPLRSGRYPEGIAGFSDRWTVGAGIVEEGHLAAIAGSLDFLSINEYHPRYVIDPTDIDAARLAGFTGGTPSPFALGLPYLDVEPAGVAHTVSGWMIDPRGLTDLLLRVSELVPELPLYISENGATALDYRDQTGHVVDDARVDYLDGHIRAALDAVDRGADLRGYFAWSFLDNFEWAEGYSQRFGLVYVDYPTQERTPKRSFEWYRALIEEHTLVPSTSGLN